MNYKTSTAGNPLRERGEVNLDLSLADASGYQGPKPAANARPWIAQLMVVAIVIASTLSPAQADDSATEQVTSGQRAIVIRYDSDQITLSSMLLQALLNQPKTRKEIDERVLKIIVNDDPDASLRQQPPGVFVGFIHLSLSEDVETPKLFGAVQDAIEDQLNSRLITSNRVMLDEDRAEIESEIEETENKRSAVRQMLSKAQAVGSPELFRSVAEHMRRRLMELTIETRVNAVRSEYLRQSLGKMLTEKKDAAKKLREFEVRAAKLLGDATGEPVDASQLAMTELQHQQAVAKFGPGHPTSRALAEQVEATKAQIGLSTEQRVAAAELRTVLSEARESYAETVRRYSEVVNAHNAHELESNVLLKEQTILAEQGGKIQPTFASLQEEIMKIEAKLDALQNDLDRLYETRKVVNRKLQSIRSVTVEIW